ncbi:hypothetical protein M513_09310 [Trichuris suis]|uniref:Uncharacterized protein n=1 Tax=Trichuris suis TaxID=68888 RepID=A0A085LXZ7_9BILA|nr:hypothetical protein M513_09310 [Trichuris suis]
MRRFFRTFSLTSKRAFWYLRFKSYGLIGSVGESNQLEQPDSSYGTCRLRAGNRCTTAILTVILRVTDAEFEEKVTDQKELKSPKIATVVEKNELEQPDKSCREVPSACTAPLCNYTSYCYPASQDGEYKEKLTDEKLLKNAKID